MPRPALTDEQRDQTRKSIRQAAARLYAQNGLADISARAIAESAGVSVGTIYGYFGSLGELMQSLWKEPRSRFLDDLEQIVDQTTDPRRRLRRILEAYVQFAVDNHAVYRGAYLFVRPESHDKPTRAALGDDRFFSILRKAVADGQKTGVFRSGSARKIAQTLWAGLHGALALPVNIDRLALDPPERIARHMVDVLQEWVEAS